MIEPVLPETDQNVLALASHSPQDSSEVCCGEVELEFEERMGEEKSYMAR